MERIKLGELCDLKSGYAFKSSDYVEKSSTLNCRMSNIRPGAIFDIEYNVKYLPDEYADKYKDFLLHDDDIIIAMTDLAGDPKILGVPAKVITNGYNILQNQRVGKLIIKDEDKINFDFLKYALSNPQNREYYKKFAGGGLQINISNKDILNIQIPIYDKQEQIEISQKLNKTQVIIDIRKKQIKELDELIKSQFAEMFENNKDVENKKIVDICSSIVRGPFGSALKKEFFVEKGENTYKVYEQKNAINCDWKLGKYYIDEEKFNELKRFECKAKDIIMSCSGTIGKFYQLPDDIDRGVINQALLKLTMNEDVVLPRYFIDYMKMNLNSLDTKGSGLQNIGSVSYIKEMEIPIPKLELQAKYLNFVKQIDKQKFEIQKSLEEMKELQESLMNKYFN